MTFSKEFELLKKFVALANNNPNEHEANVAARRVCLMLAKHDFAFIQQIQQSQEPSPNKNQYNPNSQKYQRPPYEPQPAYTRRPPTYDDIFNEFFGGNRGGGKSQPFNPDNWYYQRPPRDAEEYRKQYSRANNPDYIYDPIRDKYIRLEKEKDLKCTKCHKIFKTKFVGLPQVFVCFTCQWRK